MYNDNIERKFCQDICLLSVVYTYTSKDECIALGGMRRYGGLKKTRKILFYLARGKLKDGLIVIKVMNYESVLKY